MEDDAVFGVRNSLCVSFETRDAKEEARQLGMQAPFCRVDYGFRLKPRG